MSIASRRTESTHRLHTGHCVATLWLLIATGCGGPDGSIDRSDALAITSETSAPTDLESIRAFCGDCHRMPLAASFDKERWHHEVTQGFTLYDRSGRDDMIKPDFDATLEYFSNGAPERLEFGPTGSVSDELFELEKLQWGHSRSLAAVSDIRPLVASQPSLGLLVTDIWTGDLFTSKRLADGTLDVDHVGDVAHPARAKPTDLDGDGIGDFVVADLGTFNPEYRDQAGVWYLNGDENGGFKLHPIRMGLSRVADVEPIDHDGDGDVDLVVSDFGMHFVGAIYLATNVGNDSGLPRFEWSTIDPRPGAIETQVVDFDRDGKPDIVALVSQHHETIEVHLNRGDGQFDVSRIYQAADPSYGSSGIEVVDLDGDEDLDVVYTNGDTFDDTLAKPYHAIHWLENQGVFPFTHHVITSMPGVYCAVAGDIDLDGDLDIAAVALLGQSEIDKQPEGTFDGVIWLEQTSKGVFTRHAIVSDDCSAATCQLVDWDNDGDLDLIVPPYRFDREPSKILSWFQNTTR